MILLKILPPAFVVVSLSVIEAWSMQLLPRSNGNGSTTYGGASRRSQPSPPNRNERYGHDECHHHIQQSRLSDRRRFFSQVVTTASTAFATTTTTAVVVSSSPSSCHAACLPGDTRTECIGVYKVPIDDNVFPYVGSPEALKKFAPDLQYVPPIAVPQSLQDAFDILETQRLAGKDIQQVVSSGKLEEAGIKVLNLIPKITTAGRVVLATVREQQQQQQQQQLKTTATTTTRSTSENTNLDVVNELQFSKLEGLFNDMVGLWSECDIVIGQGIRGQLGVSAVAQIQILECIQDASIAYDEFLLSSEKILKTFPP